MAHFGNFDATQVEPAAPFDALQPGAYKVQIVKSDLQSTKTGGAMLVLEMDVIEGPAQGRKLWDRLNIVNANAQAQEIANRTLSAICHAVGVLQVSDSEQLHFRPLIVEVKTEYDNRDQEVPPEMRRTRNTIKAYKPANPASQPASTPAPAPASTPPTSSSTLAPWKKTA